MKTISENRNLNDSAKANKHSIKNGKMIFDEDKNPKLEISKDSKNFPELGGLKFEDTLNLKSHPVPLTTGKRESQSCKTHIQINGKGLTEDDLLNENIEYLAFIQLYKLATTLAGANKNYVTGLRISFGLNKDKISLLYTPVSFIDPRPIYGPKSELIGYEYTVKDGDFFVYADGSFNLANEDEKEYLKQYTNTDPQTAKIRIKHKPSEKIATPFTVGDVESVIFSFQEIFALVHDNISLVLSNAKKYIQIYNYIRQVKSGGPEPLNKHCLLMFSSDTKGSQVSVVDIVSFRFFYADLPHLCPPSCGAVTFQLE